MFRAILAALVFTVLASAASSARNVIVDTDAGTDDLLALAFLLSRTDVKIEAVTVVSGVALVPAGARNILRLLEAAGKGEIPVYLGAETTPNAFPDAWRSAADELPGVSLPATRRQPQSQSAADFLVERLHRSSEPVSMLALGPLTNLAAAFARYPEGVRRVEDLVIMGGAIRVKGNLPEAGPQYAKRPYAEWNIFADPAAARRVLASGALLRFVPLDATNHVPIDADYVAAFKNAATTPLGVIAAQILESSRALIDSHIFFAWDPLAAVALVNPKTVAMTSLRLAVLTDGIQAGRTRELPEGPSNARAALTADATLFRELFLKAFMAPAK